MTTRYKAERLNGEDKKKAVMTALRTSAPSIIVSAMGLFSATFGVALYSNIDIVGSMCMLMARGAIISVRAGTAGAAGSADHNATASCAAPPVV